MSARLVLLPILLTFAVLVIFQIVLTIWFYLAAFGSGFLWGCGAILIPLGISVLSHYLPMTPEGHSLRVMLSLVYLMYVVCLIAFNWDRFKMLVLLWFILLVGTVIAVVFLVMSMKTPEETAAGFLHRLRMDAKNTTLNFHLPIKNPFGNSASSQESTSIFSYQGRGYSSGGGTLRPTSSTYLNLSVSEQKGLIQAIQNQSLERVKLLIGNRKVNLNQLSEQGQTPLTHAVLYGSAEIVELLLDRGADPHIPNAYHKQPLEIAKQNHLTDREQILENVLSTERLQDLVRTNHPELIRQMLDSGTDINQRSETGETALMEATALGYLDIVELLIRRGADLTLVNQKNQTALDLAKENGRSTIGRLLIIHSGRRRDWLHQ